MKTVTFDTLNAEWRCAKNTLQGTDLGLRMRRALSWIECAGNADNYDAKFIFYWIAFNAVYGRRDRKPRESKEHEEFSKYFDVILGLDADKAIHNAISNRFSGSVRRFLKNRYVFRQFWEHHNDNGHDDWKDQFEQRWCEMSKALGPARRAHHGIPRSAFRIPDDVQIQPRDRLGAAPFPCR